MDKDRKKELREKARKRWEHYDEEQKSQTPADVKRLVEELNIHQIELELQNEELKQAQEALNVEKKRFEDLFEQAPIGYFLHDEDSTVTGANRAMLELMDMGHETLRGERFTQFVDPAYQDAYHIHLRELRKGCQSSCEIKLKLTGRASRFVRLSSCKTKNTTANNELVRTAVTPIDDLVEVQDKLSEALRYAEKLNKVVPSGVMSVDTKQRVLSWNDEAERITGYPAAEIIGRHCNEIFQHPCTEACGLFDKGETQLRNKECSILTKDGNRKTILKNSERIYDEDGKAIGGIESFTDISRQKETREHLNNSLSFLETLLETIPNPIFYKDMEGRYRGCNEAFVDFIGIRRDELLGKTASDISPAENAEIYSEKDMELIRHGGLQVYESRVYDNRRGENRDVIFYKQLYRETGQEKGGILGLIVDISQRKKTEKLLRESEQNFRQLAGNIDQVFWLEDEKTIFFINPAFNRIWEMPAEDVLVDREKLYKALAREDRVRIEKAVRLKVQNPYMLKEKEPIIETEVELQAGGKAKTINLQLFPVLDDDKKLARIVGLAEDITEEKKAQEKRKEVELNMRSNEMKEQFLANMSHEIRTPMNGINGLLSYLEKTRLDEEQQGFVASMRKSADNLLNIINDLLDISKIEAGKMSLKPTVFNIRKCLQHQESLFGPAILEKGLKTDIKVDEAFPELVKMDENRLTQILSNLVSNAVKFTEEGKISISLELLNKTGEKVTGKIMVQDTGTGISEEDKKNLFSKFTQVENKMTSQYGGTGLGLAICKELSMMLGGTIGLESEEGQGSTFWFTFSAEANHLMVDEKKPEKSRSGKLGLHVLVAEDKEVNRKVLKLMLDNLGCSHDIAENGQEAVKRYTKGKHDLVLMDVHMPVMDGLEATRSILNNDNKAVIIALSADASPEEVQKTRSAGMKSYLYKPVEIKELYRQLLKYSKNG